MGLVAGDTVSILLSGFGGLDSNCTGSFSSPPGKFGSASWSQGSNTLQMGLIDVVQAMQPIRVIIPSSAGITLPSSGILPNSHFVIIRFFAVGGNVDNAFFSTITPVGFFVGGFPVLSMYSLPVSSAVSIPFSSTSFSPPFISPAPSFSNSTKISKSFCFSGTIGTSLHNRSAVLSSVVSTSKSTFRALISISTSSATTNFASVQSDEIALVLSFASGMQIDANDTLFLTLPGFNFASSKIVVKSNSNAKIVSAYWIYATSTVLFWAHHSKSGDRFNNYRNFFTRAILANTPITDWGSSAVVVSSCFESAAAGWRRARIDAEELQLRLSIIADSPARLF